MTSREDIPSEVVKAVQEAVSDADQPEKVADRILAWYESISTGRDSMADAESVNRRVSVILDAVDVEDPSEEEQ